MDLAIGSAQRDDDGMRALVRGHDWGRTSLGDPAHWPASLRSTAAILLAAASPMAVCWGRNLVLLYNDAWRDLIGNKHPQALGQPVHTVWPEIWPTVEPLLAGVFAGEGGVELCEQKLALHRNGVTEDAWFTFTFDPIPLDDGSVGGILGLAVETTARVRLERALRDSEDRQVFLLEMGDAMRDVSEARSVMAVAAERVGRKFAADRVGYAEIDDESGVFDVHADWCASGVPSLAGRHRLDDFGPALIGALRAGRVVTFEDALADPLTTGTETANTYRDASTRAAMTVPLVKQGRLVAALYVHMRDARCWTAAEQALARNVAEEVWVVVERARTETALRDSETYVRLLLESTAEGFYAVDRDGRTTHCNPAFLKMLGFASESEAIGHKLHDRVHHTHPDGSAYAAADCPIYRCASDGKPAHVHGEFFYRLDGSAIPVEYWAYPIVRDGRQDGAVCTFLDMTERKRAEDALRESEARFKLIADSAPVPMWVTQMDRTRSFVNLAYAEFLGVGYEEALSLDWRTRIHPDDVDRIRADQLDKECALVPFTLEARYCNAAGEWRWLRSESQPRRDAAGNHLGFIGVAYDITSAKQAAAALQTINDSLEARVEQRTQERDRVWALSRDLLVIIDAHGTLKAVNPAWQTILGHDPAEVVGMNYRAFVCPEDHAISEERLQQAFQANHQTNFVNCYTHKNGSPRWLSWHTSLAGDLVYGYGRDITSEKRQADALRQAEEALRQSQKMEAVGQMTGGVAHDFNNLLQGISGALEMLSRKHVHSDDARKLVRLAGGAVERGAQLTKHLLAFARKQQLAAQATDVNANIIESSDLLARSLGGEVAIEHRLPDGIWMAFTDPNQLDVAILNLVINARDAMPGGGTITIATENVSASGPHRIADWPTDLERGEYVRLSVSDTGTGIAEDVRARVFEPFFTTKNVGKGTGLGLSQVHGFAHQSGGTVRLRTTPGQGTTVEIFLPRALSSPAAVEETALAEWRGTETVLVVDDDADVRELTVAALQEGGYRVLAADGGKDGLEVLKQEATIDLLLIDYIMPVMSGAECVRRARTMRPDLRVIFMTGFADLEAVAEHAGPHEIIYKPFKLADLAERVGSALAAPARLSLRDRP